MKLWKSYSAVAAGSAALAVLAFWLAMRNWADRWQPTGDGRTIVNVRTGEVRITATGKTVGQRVSTSDGNWREIALANGRHFQVAQAFVLTVPKAEADAAGYYMPGGWLNVIRPFEGDVFPEEDTRNWFVEGIATSLREGAVHGPKWQELFDHLRALRYDKPSDAEWMTRTPKQLTESRAILIGVKGR